MLMGIIIDVTVRGVYIILDIKPELDRMGYTFIMANRIAKTTANCIKYFPLCLWFNMLNTFLVPFKSHRYGVVMQVLFQQVYDLINHAVFVREQQSECGEMQQDFDTTGLGVHEVFDVFNFGEMSVKVDYDVVMDDRIVHSAILP